MEKTEQSRRKPLVVWTSIASVVFILVLVCTIVLQSVPLFYNTVVSVFGGSERVLISGDPTEYTYYSADYANKKEVYDAANAFNQEVVKEGIVLLKNEDGTLPLKKGARITVFGKNSVNLVLGGSGSNAGSASETDVNLNEYLRESGFVCNTVTEGFYKNDRESGDKRPSNPAIGTILTGFPTAESALPYPERVTNSYSDYSDAAVVVISRICGEGYDLPRTMFTNANGDYKSWNTAESARKKISGARSADDHYLQLDQNETDMLKEACSHFEKVVLIVNSASPLELGFLSDPSHYAYQGNLSAALLVGCPGSTGMAALGGVLSGEDNPSGRTADTFVSDFKNDPTWNNFGNNNLYEGNGYIYNGKSLGAYFVEYREGIYTGYRYYETKSYESGDGWYEKNVVYPFGYGLSYTDFESSATALTPNGSTLTKKGTLTFDVEVSNTGNYDGKEVVQLYYSAPYTSGGIEKAHVVLGDFAKTKILQKNGGKQTVRVEIDVRDMASYDYNDANGDGHKGYELEAGTYTIYIGDHAHCWADEGVSSFTYVVPSGGFVYDTEENGTKIENLFDDVSDGIDTYLSRAENFKNQNVLQGASDTAYRTVDKAFVKSLTYSINDKTSDPWYSATKPTQSEKTLSSDEAKIKLYDLIGKDYEDDLWDDLLDQLTVDQMRTLVGIGNFQTTTIENIDKPATNDCDGPMGFALFMGSNTVYDTCFYASETVLAQTFNKDLAFEMGKMIGNEGIIGNERGDGAPYSGWYAPAVNVHRSQFGGRNFEYYSEDPVLSASMAAGVVKGAQSKGVYTFVKHFALNEQETNRSTNGVLTWANEQCMREIYFKPFRECVVEGKTTAFMSSFNRLGTTWAGGSYNLLTRLLRDEWGFIGTVITDFNSFSYMNTDQMLRAGGDLNLCAGIFPTSVSTATEVTALRRATKNILYTVANSCAMNGHGENVVWGYSLPAFMVWLIIANVALFIFTAIMFVVTVRYSKKTKGNKKEVID